MLSKSLNEDCAPLVRWSALMAGWMDGASGFLGSSLARGTDISPGMSAASFARP